MNFLNFTKKLWQCARGVFIHKFSHNTVVANGTPIRDRRLYSRIKFNVKIAIRNCKRPEYLKAKSVDLSFNGVGVKFPSYVWRIFKGNDFMEIWIYLPDRLEPLRRWGRIIWMKKGYFFYRGGIQFQEEGNF